MSKSVEEFKTLMESDRGEASLYETAGPDDQVYLPITRSGFEAMVAAACKLVNLEVTGPHRNVSVGFLHSLGRTTPKTSIRAMSDAIWNTLSNHTTYTIDQEIKRTANEELREEQEKLKKAELEEARARGLSRQAAKLAERQAKADARASKKNSKNGAAPPASSGNEKQAS